MNLVPPIPIILSGSAFPLSEHVAVQFNFSVSGSAIVFHILFFAPNFVVFFWVFFFFFFLFFFFFFGNFQIFAGGVEVPM